jgi:chromosome segregation protein
MRLTKIKLAGFKSFVDPTLFHLPSALVGIIGPNGCGKSNLIDAVRWVMGESSARNLRGESMADVIFNGSATRKPVGQATIELVFDNSDGRLGGPWAQYNEIAIKRLLTRDGQSSYFLNGTRCRRRDITDVFLGTGLGPRSYAIIEQGMISRIIEARPEELRVFFEEAAGISKYKERRRETETRIAHTQENLNRLNDLREELGRQLQTLQRQARAAEQFRTYQTEERRLKAELLSLRWRVLDGEVGKQQGALREQETRLEAVLAEQRALEARLVASRERQAELNAAVNQAQERYYALGTAISRLEQQLHHRRELNQRQRAEIQQTEQTLRQITAQIQQDEIQLQELAKALEATQPAMERHQSQAAALQSRLADTEILMQQWQMEWEAFSRRAGEPQRAAEVERTRIEHREQQLARLERRCERLRLEQEELDDQGLLEQLQALEQAVQAVEQELVEHQTALAEAEAGIVALRAAQRDLSQAVHTSQARVQAHRGRLASLKTLQEAALGKQPGMVEDWLSRRNLTKASRLAERLWVEPGWETAAEALFGTHLEAVCVADLEAPATGLEELAQGHLSLFATEALDDIHASAAVDAALSSKFQAPGSLISLLAGIRLAADLDEALARRTRLAPHESLVTPDGIRVGRNWLRIKRGTDAESGVLARERDLQATASALLQEEAALEQYAGRLAQDQTDLQDLERRRGVLQEAVNRAHREQTRGHSDIQTLSTRLAHMQTRRETVTEEYQELAEQIEQEQQARQEARLRLEEALQAMEQFQEERAVLLLRRDTLQETLAHQRRQVQEAQRALQEQAVAEESLRTTQASTRQAVQRAKAQQQQLEQRRDQLAASLVSEETPAERAELAGLLDERVDAEACLGAARQTYEDQETQSRELEQARSHRERQLQELRQGLEGRRLAMSESKVRQQTLMDQLQELGMALPTVLAQLPDNATEAEWQELLDRMAKRIQRLGPINLAAIEEFAQLSERKHYLDAQNQDLTEALTTLQSAMQRIDRETRQRFRDTFERVNGELQTLFPRLFGGGQAHLELDAEDVLDAGVVIMARPPGKRITHIHLLSGGEKALTAVALVFAIFQLNPAPFCMLDEVDAPLDEANIGRFGELVRELSTRIQFIFITHNKATMEMAQHLLGVTMQEPGVSRLVAVDVEEAVRLAAVN